MAAEAFKTVCLKHSSDDGENRSRLSKSENVFDFSIGNPSVPAPDCVKEALAKLSYFGALAAKRIHSFVNSHFSFSFNMVNKNVIIIIPS